ncbi:MAG: YebC/PmpR family DNA-binding transcriptional regulator [Candidatus Giovannonibacteria bacterium]|nr:MAG: YebC/PmpR family DNA-binding transcriptional regulator [Candidatus Giovannonibacteria bacterium]
MSGHSKWAQIKYKKGLTDAKRGKIFSKLSRLITIAAKSPPAGPDGAVGAGGGPDPKINSRLAAAIEEARKANMPSDNINRAIKKASAKESIELKEVIYEAYGPGGSAIIVVAVTDNPNRTTNEIKHILSEHGAKLGVEGSVMWAFDKKDKEYIAKYPVSLSGDDSKKFEALLEALSDHDDAQEVYSNAEIK